MKTLVRCASLVVVVAVVFLLRGGGHASDPLTVAMANAATTCPDGFTVKVHGLPAGSDPTSSLSASCVLDLGIPAGTPGTNGVSGYALAAVTVKTTKSNSSDRLAAVAKCPAGKKAIGGGASIAAGTGEVAVIPTSEPTPSGQGWRAIAVSDEGTPSEDDGASRISGRPPGVDLATLRVTAICAVVS